ncbi:sulfotransferase domain-containing protein [Oscillatoria sp. CS-180]|uniref:sulfotransferase domain-containing protein n=1 Tax=Oscillatoria sp. CS-180 TaxID=3021720 RepID=UPI00232BFAEF|nr:sulfotransferase domain-containing protein [Oscillatoria sp. CS-180]MDB9525074.1 sulfotransferase domain-containing protein [Oscillatoria sp. CS-180]
MRRLPDFLVIGVVKGGTTSLYKYLIQHPQIISSLKKEVHYFNHENYKSRNVGWYRTHFPLKNFIAPSRILTGEASPSYFHNPEGPDRVHALLPDTKLVLLLRNPIDRAYSHYSMNRKNRRKRGLEEPPSFAEIVRREMAILREKRPPTPTVDHLNPLGCCYVSSGIYVYSLQNWLQQFDLENVLILHSQDLFDTPEKVTNQVYRFLNLPQYSGTYDVFNAGSYAKIDLTLQEELFEFFKPYNERLFEYCGRDFGWNKQSS